MYARAACVCQRKPHCLWCVCTCARVRVLSGARAQNEWPRKCQQRSIRRALRMNEGVCARVLCAHVLFENFVARLKIACSANKGSKAKQRVR